MDAKYATMMGYTQEELVQYFGQHVHAITQERNAQDQSTSEEEILAEIKAWYNGYRFSKAETYVYNPFSTLRFFKTQEPNSYWYATGTPSFLVHELKQRPHEAVSLSQMLATQSRLSDISKVARISLPALLFQTGYLTIQDYKVDLDAYQLDFPNKEVRDAFFGSMLEELTEVDSSEVHLLAKQLQASLSALELETFVAIINTHFAKLPYHTYQHAKEGFYQAIFLICLELSGIQTQGEVVTSKGRIDVLCELAGMFYIFELKLTRKAAIAMGQALDQEYSQRCRHQGKKIVVMGVKFASANRGIAAWQGELLDEHGKLIRKLAPAAKQ